MTTNRNKLKAFPDKLKYSVVTPLFKHENKENISKVFLLENYYVITRTSFSWFTSRLQNRMQRVVLKELKVKYVNQLGELLRLVSHGSQYYICN